MFAQKVALFVSSVSSLCKATGDSAEWVLGVFYLTYYSNGLLFCKFSRKSAIELFCISMGLFAPLTGASRTFLTLARLWSYMLSSLLLLLTKMLLSSKLSASNLTFTFCLSTISFCKAYLLLVISSGFSSLILDFLAGTTSKEVWIGLPRFLPATPNGLASFSYFSAAANSSGC